MKEFSKKSDIFRNKEQDFDNLIDIAVKARKDDHIGSLTIHPLNIAFKWGGEEKIFALHEVCDGISFFKSFYTETFVFEGKEDLDRMARSPIKSIILTNGEDLVRDVWFDDEDSLRWYGIGQLVNLKVLKGAIITQEKRQ